MELKWEVDSHEPRLSETWSECWLSSAVSAGLTVPPNADELTATQGLYGCAIYALWPVDQLCVPVGPPPVLPAR